MTTVNEWINQDARRRAPEFDFGTQWTREHDPNTDWAVTYNTGTGELYARTRNGDDVEVLGQFSDPQDVAEALPDWGRRSTQPGSLEWVRREALSLQQSQPTVNDNDPIYAVVLSVDGDPTVLRTPQSIGDIAIRLDAGDLAHSTTAALDYSDVNTGDRTDRVVMWVDDRTNGNDLAVNSAATQLYGTGWPILGDAVVVTDNKQPLPPALVQDIIPNLDQPDPTYGLRISPDGNITAIDNWSDTKVAGRDLGGQLQPWTVDADSREQSLRILVDPKAHNNGLERNDAATAAYGIGQPIHGDAVIASLDGRALLPEVIVDLNSDMAPHRDVRALDWDDHHRDRDTTSDIGTDLDDIAFQPAQLDPVDLDGPIDDHDLSFAPTKQDLDDDRRADNMNRVHQVLHHMSGLADEPDASAEFIVETEQHIAEVTEILANSADHRLDDDVARQLPDYMVKNLDLGVEIEDDDLGLDL